MKTILAAIDFSPVATKVIAAARRFGQLTGARIVVTHVVVPPVFDADLTGLALEDLSSLTTAALQAADRQLESLHRRSKNAVTTLPAEIGSPVPLILRQAREVRADCIVLGSHGHGVLYDLAVGSVARGILKRATCPVLVVPAAARARRPQGT